MLKSIFLNFHVPRVGGMVRKWTSPQAHASTKKAMGKLSHARYAKKLKMEAEMKRKAPSETRRTFEYHNHR
jgi:hypothetical protein